MPAEKFLNGPQSTLTASLTTSATSVPVVDGSLFSAGDGYQWRAVIADETLDPIVIERVLVTARSGNTLTVTRATEGTTGTAFPSGATFVSVLTAGALDDVFATKMVNPMTAKGDVMVGSGVAGTNVAVSSNTSLVFTRPSSPYWFAGTSADKTFDGDDATGNRINLNGSAGDVWIQVDLNAIAPLPAIGAIR